MRFLMHSRVLGNQALSLVRQFNNSGRVSYYASQQRTQHTSRDQTDAVDRPIEMENPYKKEKKICILCKNNIVPDYKNVRMLSQFQSNFTGKVYGRHITGLCKKQQELVELEITKAQHAGLMPIYNKNINFAKDPSLFNTENPFRRETY